MAAEDERTAADDADTPADAAKTAGEPGDGVPSPPDNPPQVSLGQAVVLGVLAQGLSIVSGIARSKVTAVVLSPAQFGMTSEITQLVNFANIPSAAISWVVVLAKMAEANRSRDRQRINDTFNASFTLVLILSVVPSIVAVLISPWALPQPWGRHAWHLALLAAIGAVLSQLNSISVQSLMASGALRKYTLYGIAATLLSLVLTTLGTVFFQLEGQFAAAAFLAALLVIPAHRLARSAIPELRSSPSLHWNRPYVRDAMKLALNAMIGYAFSQGALLLIRWSLDGKGGPAMNGQFQAAYAIAGSYFTLLLSSLATHALPRFAAAKDSEELTREVDAAIRFILRVVPALLAVVLAFRTVAIRVLYSHRFDDSVEVLGYMIVGDMVRCVGWAQSSPLVFRGHVRGTFICEVFVSATFGLSAAVLVRRFGLVGVGYAYVLAQSLYVLATGYALRAWCGVALRKRAMLVAYLWCGALLVAQRIGGQSAAFRYSMAAIAFAWLWYTEVVQAVWRRIVARLPKRAAAT